jgi:putative two-component system response regulator
VNGRVLVTDDRRDNRELTRAILESQGYEVVEACSGEEALALVTDGRQHIDAVVLDVRMQGMDGLEVLRRIKADRTRRLLPVLMVTALGEHDSKLAALHAGADDYLAKPVDSVELLARVRNAIAVRRLATEMAQWEATLRALSVAVELRDQYTEDHTLRVTAYATALCRTLGLDEESVADIAHGAAIHDVGKVSLPDAVLRKPAALSASEYELVKQHPLVGARICSAFGSDSTVARIIRHHHERIDGSGYPDGLAGDTIPLGARIVAVADSYDAMTSDRPYRPALASTEAQRRLRAGAGSQWDCSIVEAFLATLRTNHGLRAAARAGGAELRSYLALA